MMVLIDEVTCYERAVAIPDDKKDTLDRMLQNKWI